MNTTRLITSLLALPLLTNCGGAATDTDGNDTATTRTLIDEDGDGVPDGLDTDGDGIIDIRGVGIDEDGDGTYDGIDTDGDGIIDEYVDPPGDGDGDGDGDVPGGTGGTTFVPDDYAEARGVDVLFVVDNSVSMGDKQQLLFRSVNYFMEGLLGLDTGGDVHVGVISSSLGGHGSKLCSWGTAEWNNDDRGHLMPSVRESLDSPDFLSWSGGDSAAEVDAIASATDQLMAVGERGCGFEATLEAWYRFLVDPQPPEEIVIDGSTQRAVMATDASGIPLIDATVLAQRDAFLRPDSVLAIVILSDENDCSAMDGGSYYNNAGFGYLAAEASFSMPVSTPECEANPNDKCCFSCLQQGSPPDGCSTAACDSCATLAPEEDRANLRCFEQKRRFGVDLLYPVERYIDALTKHHIIDARNGAETENPLLVGGSGAPIYRDPNHVIFTGVVGVPWQDVATEESLEDPSIMEVLSASAFSENNVEAGGRTINRWDLILGSPGLAENSKRCEGPGVDGCGATPVPPADPFMIESIAERDTSLSHPLTGDSVVAATSTSPLANAINGHEADHQVLNAAFYPDGGAANDDLQLACIFPLETPRDCLEGDIGCDCGDEPLRNRAICQPPAGGAAGNTQYWGKVYPGVRILQVLRGAGENAVVGSACPKIATGSNQASPHFGYNPIFQALIEEIDSRF